MTPDRLAEYLKALRDAKIQSARLNLENGISLELHFQVEVPDLPDAINRITPGGWKSPQNLDDPQQLDADYLNDVSK